MTQQRARGLCLAGLALTGIYSWVTLPLAPSLIGSHPVLLEALRGSISSMITAGALVRVGHAALPLVLLAPVLTLLKSGLLLWWAGRLWGPSLAHMLARGSSLAQRRSERAIRWGERYGSWTVVFAYFLPVPSGLIYAAAGWTGMSLRRVLALDLLGTSLWILAVVALGYSIGSPAVKVAKAINHYGLLISLALLGVVLLIGIVRSPRLSLADEQAE
ncbi:MAG TPA: VTT domain-containing protein [Solirubrobacteraceae bacterium]|jgi:membrane protein DedA with SNARE-associated domain